MVALRMLLSVLALVLVRSSFEHAAAPERSCVAALPPTSFLPSYFNAETP